MKSVPVLLLTALVVLGETLVVSGEQEELWGSRTTSNGELGSDEELFLFFLFSFFALCVSLFGSFLLYISYLDDRIMKLYVDEGNLVEGEVVATEFTRGVDENMGNYNNQKEYFVSIEYSILLSENYPIRIRKQLRVLESDFYHPGQNSLSCTNNDACSFRCTPKSDRKIEIIASRDSFFKSFQFDHGRKLQLLVLPNHHLSALPACQVERRLSARYRLFSILFVVAAILIAVFCFHLAVPLLKQHIYGEKEVESSGYSSIIRGQAKFSSFLTHFVFVLLAVAPIPCIHHLLHDFIQNSLEGEYFEMGGEVIKGGQDDSSLSSRSDFGYFNRSASGFGYSNSQSTLT